jgi:methyl-accepting chemotaxis protein
MDAMRALLADIGSAEEQLLKGRKALSADVQARTSMFLVGGGVFAVAAAAAIAWLLSGSITRPLARAVDLAQRVARGDLTTRIEVKSRDEIGALLAALGEMNRALAGIVGAVRQGTDAIGTASAEIATGNLDLPARTEQQASSLEETASSMEELTSTVRQNADHARAASRKADETSAVAARGGAIVEEVVQTMQRISASSARIADIIGVIDGIAFQTNILALNAAVEAARAGEQGRGFAVVAGEVRTLAHRSAAAAKEIKDLIVHAAGEVGAGTQLVNQAGTTIGELVAGVREVGATMGQISAASGEQLAGIEQVNGAVVQMDNVTQQNAALVEQAAAAASALQEQARRLAGIVSVFTVPADGGKGGTPLPRQAVPALAP